MQCSYFIYLQKSVLNCLKAVLVKSIQIDRLMNRQIYIHYDKQIDRYEEFLFQKKIMIIAERVKEKEKRKGKERNKEKEEKRGEREIEGQTEREKQSDINIEHSKFKLKFP